MLNQLYFRCKHKCDIELSDNTMSSLLLFFHYKVNQFAVFKTISAFQILVAHLNILNESLNIKKHKL